MKTLIVLFGLAFSVNTYAGYACQFSLLKSKSDYNEVMAHSMDYSDGSFFPEFGESDFYSIDPTQVENRDVLTLDRMITIDKKDPKKKNGFITVYVNKRRTSGKYVNYQREPNELLGSVESFTGNGSKLIELKYQFPGTTENAVVLMQCSNQIVLE